MLERATLALRMQNFAEAERLAAEVVKTSRTDIVAIWVLGRALLAQNRVAEAIVPLDKAARRTSDPGIETLLGAALGGSGRRMEAVEQLRRTAARRPPFLPAFQELAGQLAKDRRVDEAIATIGNALALAPESIDLQLDLARLHLECNARGEARPILVKAHKAAPGRPDISTLLARVLRQDGDYAAAAEMYRLALALRPDHAVTRADLAACLFELGQREAGEASLRSALRGRPRMLAQVAYTLVHSSRGRFFFRPSALKTFLQGDMP
ncbi:tetratricopeptide repeat protein [Bradyrhizobium sp. 139]|uniref:tetratricopeptide repeat protein n=1 Tax=Bradyrhizobium sp. 139 TaxID=2782616 RepID=UPI00201BC09B|nr:tetratricopeptide repeat protein [Bradyrhizobium sp. 139]